MREIVGAQAGITFVPLGELARWATLRQWGGPRRAELSTWLAARPMLPYTDDIARILGEISAHATRRGRPPPQNDTWIAACCLAYDLPLATPERQGLPRLRRTRRTGPARHLTIRLPDQDDAQQSATRRSDRPISNLLDTENWRVAVERICVPFQHVDTGQLAVLDRRYQW